MLSKEYMLIEWINLMLSTKYMLTYWINEMLSTACVRKLGACMRKRLGACMRLLGASLTAADSLPDSR